MMIIYVKYSGNRPAKGEPIGNNFLFIKIVKGELALIGEKLENFYDFSYFVFF